MGSLLLTPQENESLFTFLGKKCVVSGRDPRRPHPTLPHGPGLEGQELGAGKEARAVWEGPAAGLAYPARCRRPGPTP